MSSGGITAMVREFAAAHTHVRKKQIRDALDLSAYKVGKAVDTLSRQGWLHRTGPGVYQFRDQALNERPRPIRDRIWRAMRINPIFSASELARQAGTTRNYANKMLRRFRLAGLVEPYGARETPGGAWEKRWMLSAKGKEHRERPEVKPWRPDPLVVMAVELNRLVCTGVARNDAAAGTRARELCAKIAEALKAERGKDR